LSDFDGQSGVKDSQSGSQLGFYHPKWCNQIKIMPFIQTCLAQSQSASPKGTTLYVYNMSLYLVACLLNKCQSASNKNHSNIRNQRNQNPSKFRPLHPCLPHAFFSLMPFSPPRVPRYSARTLEIPLCCSCLDWAPDWRCHHRACRKQISWLCRIQSSSCGQHSVSQLVL
jgi:hypothetical protein